MDPLPNRYDEQTEETPVANPHLIVEQEKYCSLQIVEQTEPNSLPIVDRRPWKQRRFTVNSKFHTDVSNYKSYASIGRRVQAYLIDWFIVTVIGTCLVSAYIATVLGVVLSRPDHLFQFLMITCYEFLIYAIGTAVPIVSSIIPLLFLQNLLATFTRHDYQSKPEVLFVLLLLYVFPCVLDALYRACMESSPTQATLGKMMMRIYVVDQVGKRLTLRRALIRHFSKSICILSAFKRILNPTVKTRQEPHDKISGTVVLRERGADDNL